MNIIYILLALIALLSIEGFIYRRYWPKGIKASVKFSQDCAVEGDTVELCETVEYTGILPLPWVRMKFRISRGLGFENTPNSIVTDYYNREEIFSIRQMEKITRRLPVSCDRRGQHRIMNIDVVSSDMFLTTKQVARMDGNAGIIVYPKRTNIPEIIDSVRQMMGEQIMRRNLVEDPFMFRGVRDYSPGDQISHINWRAVARTDQLAVNQYDSTSELYVSVWLNIDEFREWRDEGVCEESIRIAATIIDTLIDEGVSVALRCNGTDCFDTGSIMIGHGSSPEHKDSCLTALARLDIEKESVPMAEFTSMMPQSLNENELVVFISSSTSEKLCSHIKASTSECRLFWIAPVRTEDEARLPGLEIIENSCVWRVVCEK